LTAIDAHGWNAPQLCGEALGDAVVDGVGASEGVGSAVVDADADGEATPADGVKLGDADADADCELLDSRWQHTER